MLRDTSIRAYREIVSQLGAIHAVICTWMTDNDNNMQFPPPWTAAEIQYGLAQAGHDVEAWKRMKELEIRQLVVRQSPRTCLVNNRLADTWALYDDPQYLPPDRPPSYRATLSQVSSLISLLIDDEHMPENDFVVARLRHIQTVCTTALDR